MTAERVAPVEGPGRIEAPGAPALVSDADRAYCRDVLPRVSRTFALNIRLLAGPMRDAVRVAYLLCRTADALEDSWPGPKRDLERRFDALRAAVQGDPDAAEALAAEARALTPAAADLQLVANLPAVWRSYATLDGADRDAIAEAVGVMATGMRRYAGRAAERPPDAPYLDHEAELHDYCWVVAGCVGVMLTRMFERRAGRSGAVASGRRLTLAPVVGQALQLTNILLDWPVDIRRGRCYVPAEWLWSHGIRPRDLVGTRHPSAGAIVARLESLARGALARVPDYLATIPVRHVRYRQFCLWPTLWAVRSLEQARRLPDFPWGERRPKLARGQIRAAALQALLAGHAQRSVRGLFSVAR